jgi:hypothetical protein
MTELDPREITDPQPSRFVPRWRCDEMDCPRQGEVVEDDGSRIDILDYLTNVPQPVVAIARQARLPVHKTVEILTLSVLEGAAVEAFSGAYKLSETAVPDFAARIDSSDERAAAWQIVFDGAAVPLRSPIPHLARLPGRGEELVYLLDIEALTAEQRGRLVAHIAAKFNIPAKEVDADLDTHGCPILAEHVTVSIANPWRWL